MRRVQAFVILKAGDLDGIELVAAGVIDQLDRFPGQVAAGIRIEAQANSLAGRSTGRPRTRHGRGLRTGFQESSPAHQAPLLNEIPAKLTTLWAAIFHCS